MAVRTRALSLQNFLLTYVVGDEPVELVPQPRSSPDLGMDIAEPNGGRLTGRELRAEVERHTDRTMNVVTPGKIETITRCGVCPKEDTRPCIALRVLALPYARHPAYRSEWHVEPAEEDAVTAGEKPDENHLEDPGEDVRALVVVSDQGVPDLPPPGNARRRMLRAFGIQISRFDFTDEELGRRGIALDPPVGQRQSE